MDKVPELEEVPEVKERIKILEEHNQEEHSNIEEKKNICFGGFRKGFLSGPSKVVRKKSEDMPHIKSKPKNNLIIKEVQEAMSNGEQVNKFHNDLSSRIKQDPDISTVLEDESWLAILSEFQQDAQSAMIKYKDDQVVKSTMKKLCNVFGDSFLHMGKNNVDVDEKLMKDLMDSPEIKAALLDPFIVQIMDFMKNARNDKAHQLIQRANEEQKKKIQVLVDHGLFHFAL